MLTSVKSVDFTLLRVCTLCTAISTLWDQYDAGIQKENCALIEKCFIPDV